MGLFRRRTPTPDVEERGLWDVPWNVGAPLTAPLDQSKALTLTAVYAAIRHICDTVSTLPLEAGRRVGDDRQPMSSLPQLFKLLDDAGTLLPWLFECQASIALRGNAVGYITKRDGMLFPIATTWLSMDDIYVDDSATPPVWRYQGAVINRDELVHIPWFKLPGKTLGLSPIEACALTVNSGLGAQSYSSDFFHSGGIPPGTFKNAEKRLEASEAQAIKARTTAAIRTRETLVYGADWDYNPIFIPPEQAQFVQSLKMNANQIAAIYGIAPEEVGGEAANSLTYSNEEMRQTTRLANLRPYLVRLEHAFSALLPERQYVKFNVDATIRADIKTRYEVYRIARLLGLTNVDEIRALEDQAPLPNGQGQDYTPLAAAAVPAGLQTFPPNPEAPPLQPVNAPATNGNGKGQSKQGVPA